MRVKSYKDWNTFHRFLLNYASKPKEERDRLLFRGHAQQGWPLVATLDRHRRFRDDADRAGYYDRLRDEFRLEVIRLPAAPGPPPDGDALELLARHHGVPSPIIDWTASPYVAAFFAFEGAAVDQTDDVAILVFDQARYRPAAGDEGLIVIDSPELIRLNRRALQQQGAFTRVLTARQPLEELLGDALSKITIPAGSRAIALADLDAMAINPTTMFADLDGAARTAIYRVSR